MAAHRLNQITLNLMGPNTKVFHMGLRGSHLIPNETLLFTTTLPPFQPANVVAESASHCMKPHSLRPFADITGTLGPGQGVLQTPQMAAPTSFQFATGPRAALFPHFSSKKQGEGASPAEHC